MSNLTYPVLAELAQQHIPEDCYFIDPKQPARTAAQFLDWYGMRIPMMSAAHSDRSRPAVPIDVGRGGGAPAGRV